MPSIIKKYQKCGKNNCHCSQNDSFHGPYYWFVRYIKPRNSFKKGKYKWEFISRNPEDVSKFIKEHKQLDLKFNFKKEKDSHNDKNSIN